MSFIYNASDYRHAIKYGLQNMWQNVVTKLLFLIATHNVGVSLQ